MRDSARRARGSPRFAPSHIAAGAKRACVASLLMAACAVLMLAPRAARGQALTVLPLRHGEISFAMSATKVNDFVGHVDTLHAEFQGTELTQATGFLELRVADMHTGIGLRDSHMRHAMREDSFPTIRFDLVRVDPGAARNDTIPAVFTGRLTIHGFTRTIQAPGTVVVRPETMQVTASTPIDMRAYGIEPPTRFFGAIRVNPVTIVTVNLTFGGR